MNKTDAEIEKALECCSNWQSDKSCEECPENTYGFGCAQKMAKHALDYINRLKAKAKEQQEEIDELRRRIVFWREDLNYQPEKERIEAIKEFAERLKDRICENVNRSLDNPNGNNYYPIDVYNDIDNLVKEMTENEGKE